MSLDTNIQHDGSGMDLKKSVEILLNGVKGNRRDALKKFYQFWPIQRQVLYGKENVAHLEEEYLNMKKT